MFVLCGWSLFDTHFNGTQEGTREPSIIQEPLQQEAIDSEEQQIMGIAYGGTKDRSSMLITPQPLKMTHAEYMNCTISSQLCTTSMLQSRTISQRWICFLTTPYVPFVTKEEKLMHICAALRQPTFNNSIPAPTQGRLLRCLAH